MQAADVNPAGAGPPPASLAGCVSFVEALYRNVDLNPDKVFVREAEGDSYTYADMVDLSRRWAAGLRSAGVGSHDRVAVMMPPSAAHTAVWLGINTLDAWFVSLNTQYLGKILEYVLRQSGSVAIVVAGDHLDAVLDVLPQVTSVVTIVVVGATPADASGGRVLRPPRAGVTIHRSADFLDVEPLPREDVVVQDSHDVYGLVYTSGTTGASKGVIATWNYLFLLHQGGTGFDSHGPDDVWYVCLPLFHSVGQSLTYMSAMRNGTVVMRERYSRRRFWPDVQEFAVTATLLTGAMMKWMEEAEPFPAEHDHRPMTCIGGPLPPDVQAFERRFNTRMFTVYGMSELSAPFLTGLSPTNAHSVGRLRPGYEVRLLDPAGHDVGPGVPGELLVRSTLEGAISPGYFDMPDATARAWRDGWFHTGDIMRYDEEGLFYFVDRASDSIKRRGENICSREVELEVDSHTGVAESAALGVDDADSGQELLVVVVPRPGVAVDSDELVRYLVGRLPAFMIPRYLTFAAAIPRTHNGKIRKVELRRWVAETDVWDRTTGRAASGTQLMTQNSRQEQQK